MRALLKLGLDGGMRQTRAGHRLVDPGGVRGQALTRSRAREEDKEGDPTLNGRTLRERPVGEQWGRRRIRSLGCDRGIAWVFEGRRDDGGGRGQKGVWEEK